MNRIRIVFKSGHVEDVDFIELSTFKNGLGQRSLSWKRNGVFSIEIDEVAAFIEIEQVTTDEPKP